MSEWVSVVKELPPKGEVVICCGPQGGRFLAKYKGGFNEDHEGVRSCYGFDPYESGPRRFMHWMPLPAPPEPHP